MASASGEARPRSECCVLDREDLSQYRTRSAHRPSASEERICDYPPLGVGDTLQAGRVLEKDSASGETPQRDKARQRVARKAVTGSRPSGKTPIEILGRLSKGALVVESRAKSWPSEGHVKTAAGSVPVSIYMREIGRTARGRAHERRFQNPATAAQREIKEPKQGYALLLGLWLEQGEDRAVVVALDAYRRVGVSTRVSLFMPLSLLEEAAHTGSAQHRSGSGETLNAFRPSELSHYVERLLDEMPLPGVTAPRAELPKQKVRIAPTSEPPPGSSIHIRPKVGMYAAFARLNYRPWFALAEFVDNSVQSYLSNRERLGRGPGTIDVRFDEEELVITDRAAGIPWRDFPRAFSPSEVPPDASGLSEFGLGMKAAACWFAPAWSVRTKAIGEKVERTIEFDVAKIAREGIEHLPVTERPAPLTDHYTVVTLKQLRTRPKGRTVSKIKEHLASIYRLLVRSGEIQIRFTSTGDTEALEHEIPKLLDAPSFRAPDEKPRLWRKDFKFTLPNSRRVWGWAGVLETGSVSKAGFAVFRRNRLIQGSVEDSYRPGAIFRSPNSYSYQRIVGELHVDGFDVSHTKDGIQWAGDEDLMLEELRRQLDSDELPLLRQAEGHRSRRPAVTLAPGFGARAIDSAGSEIQTDVAATVFAAQAGASIAAEGPPPKHSTGKILTKRTFTLKASGHELPLSIALELIDDQSRDWYGCNISKTGEERLLEVFVNLGHPFSERFLNENEEILGPLLRLAAALSLAEHTARDSGVKHAGAVRTRANEFLRNALSQALLEASESGDGKD